MGFLQNIFKGATPGGVIDSSADLLEAGRKFIDETFTSKEEKAEQYNILQDKVIEDKKNAREMYARTDNWLQKIYAIVFLLGYVALTGVMIYVMRSMVMSQVDFPDWAIAFISTIWGGTSTKVGTITDFLFGSSQGSANKDIFNTKKH